MKKEEKRLARPNFLNKEGKIFYEKKKRDWSGQFFFNKEGKIFCEKKQEDWPGPIFCENKFLRKEKKEIG